MYEETNSRLIGNTKIEILKIHVEFDVPADEYEFDPKQIPMEVVETYVRSVGENPAEWEIRQANLPTGHIVDGRINVEFVLERV